VVGRPNVGKSSLVNRIIGRREAIVQETPGVTRDRRYFVTDWAGRDFEIVDTGGLEPGPEGLEQRVVEQAELAIETADAILLVVDNTTGPVEDDHLVAQRLRGGGKPVIVVANKADDPADENEAAVFFRLGLGEPVPVSALHGRGSGDLLDALVTKLPAEGHGGESAFASIAIVGRPNVGKSSILNRLVGEARSIVDEGPGTTRDPVDSYLSVDDGKLLRLVDTAGMRRQVKVDDSIEFYGLLRSRRALMSADVAILVVDASEGVTASDQRIADEIVSSGKACVVALNKWDAIPDDETDRVRLERSINHRLRFLGWATLIRTSALRGRAVDRLIPAALGAVEAHRFRLATSEVNKIVGDAQAHRPHPRGAGKAIKILYALQTTTAPPSIVLFATGRVEESYRRYLENYLRSVHPFSGTPIRISARLRSRPKVER
jgi:GTP-binding protein